MNIEYSDKYIGFEEDMYDKLFIEDLRVWDNKDDALKEAFLRSIDYQKNKNKGVGKR